MSDGEPSSWVLSRFGPYRLKRLLGRGGMGEVYEAHDTRKGRVVALKLISRQFSNDPVFRARIQREADAAGRLTEPHVVPIHDYGEIDGTFFLEMRLIEGASLRSMLRHYGPMSPARAVAIVSQVASALDAAHAAGVTHRDVKPENILITGDDFAYLVDFGIARAAADSGLTQTGLAMGTYNYMAPERFGADEVTYRADIYSLTCVLGECLTGSPPYRCDSVERLITAHLMQPAPRPSQLRPGIVPVAFDQVIAKGMAKNPTERYRSAGELARAANQALTAPEHQAAAIRRQGEGAALLTSAVDSGLAGARHQYTPSGAGTGPWTQPARTPPRDTGDARWRGQPSGPSSAGPAGTPDLGKPPEPSRDRKVRILIGATALLVVAAVVIGYLLIRQSHRSGGSWETASGQTVLPFTGLNFRLSPGGLTLDSDGSVYITNEGMYGRVVKLAAGSSTPTVLPFSGLYEPQGVAVDSNQTVYVTDFNNRVVKLTAGSNDQSELPLTGLSFPEGVAVDSAGNVYVADRGNNRVVELAAESNTQTELPFSDLNHPNGVALDTSGNVYVTDSDNNRVLKLARGSNQQAVLPFTGLALPWGVTVDSTGAVYVTEYQDQKVVKLAAGSTTPTELSFTGLNTPLELDVDKSGNVYVADRGNNRVVRLAAS
ncbi:MAG: protein kinase [Mycobacterium sp.]|nr:protein kinase [Mycobacterium sp.]